jgi:hypothetical protein
METDTTTHDVFADEEMTTAVAYVRYAGQVKVKGQVLARCN